MNRLEARFFTVADGLLIATLLITTLVIWWRGSSWQGSYSSNGRVVYRISVVGHPERERYFSAPSSSPVIVHGLIGLSIIEWNLNGQVRIASSPCPNKLCISTGWVEAPFGTCCAPNGVVVECLTAEHQFDGITR